jgi:hypothetical protein
MAMTDRDRLIKLMQKQFTELYKDGDWNFNEMLVGVADYLLANGVIVPPCKVGDSCYPLDASETELTCEEKISRITISERNIIIGYYEHWDYYNRCRKTDNWRLPLRTRILGKGVFLTKKEAEQKLKELKDNVNL